MGGTRTTIKAKTKGELLKKYRQAARKARGDGLEPWTYDAKRVKETKDGYEIAFYAHT